MNFNMKVCQEELKSTHCVATLGFLFYFKRDTKVQATIKATQRQRQRHAKIKECHSFFDRI